MAAPGCHNAKGSLGTAASVKAASVKAAWVTATEAVSVVAGVLVRLSSCGLAADAEINVKPM
jgi:hypothetical protein